MELLTQNKRPRLSHYEFAVPEELIAQYPLKHRDRCRLMVVDRATGSIQSRRFDELAEFLEPGDLLVLNDTQVYPARLRAIKERTEARLELLLLRELDRDLWECLIKPARKVRVGNTLLLEGGVTCDVVDSTLSGSRIVRFDSPDMPFLSYLDKNGQCPLPPYIRRPAEPGDRQNYQTVYARNRGAVAAPTAGLHFTNGLLDSLRATGIETVNITLHVGIGTFQPIRVEDIARHTMGCEYYAISPEAAQAINVARGEGRRILAVGTTATRALETVAQENGQVIPGSGWTDKFIYPPYRFRAVDSLLTNFHQPRSTLVLLVAAFASRELILQAYAQAVRDRYRFFSYGDAMLIQ